MGLLIPGNWHYYGPDEFFAPGQTTEKFRETQIAIFAYIVVTISSSVVECSISMGGSEPPPVDGWLQRYRWRD